MDGLFIRILCLASPRELEEILISRPGQYWHLSSMLEISQLWFLAKIIKYESNPKPCNKERVAYIKPELGVDFDSRLRP